MASSLFIGQFFIELAATLTDAARDYKTEFGGAAAEVLLKFRKSWKQHSIGIESGMRIGYKMSA
jgi:hypothetical protein